MSARQYGVFTAQQARAAGASQGQIARRLACGEWRRIAGAGISGAHTRVDATTLISAAVLTWPDAVVLGPVAAAFHGVPMALPTTVDVHREGGSWRPRRGLVPRDVPLVHHEIEVHGGLRVASRSRAVVDALAWSPPDIASSVLAWASTRRLIDRSALEGRLAERPGARGNAQLRRLLRESRGGSLSPAEQRCATLLRRAGLTGWEANARVRVGGAVIAVADFLFREERVVVEIDGRRAHSGDEAFQRDRTRQNRLVAAGFTVLRFTWADLVDRPAEVVATIRQVLRS